MRKMTAICLKLILVFLITFAAGCNLADKAATLKNDLVNITLDQVAVQLENSLNRQFPGVQLDSPQVLNSKGEVNWDRLKQTELGNFVFYSFGDYEFKAVLSGSGVFTIQRTNTATNEIYNYAELKVQKVNGKFKVSTK